MRKIMCLVLCFSFLFQVSGYCVSWQERRFEDKITRIENEQEFDRIQDHAEKMKEEKAESDEDQQRETHEEN